MPEIKIANQDTLLDVKSKADATKTGVDTLLSRPYGGIQYTFYHEIPPMSADTMGWSVEPKAPINFSQGSAVADFQTAYLFGGAAPNDKAVYEFSPLMNEWTKISEHTISLTDSKTVFYNNACYVMAGAGLGVTLYKYTPSSDTWTALASPTYSVLDMAVAVVGSEIFACGGTNMTSELRLQKYSISNNSWTTASLPISMRKAMCGVINNEFYVISSYSGNLIKYTPSTSSWTTTLAKGPVVGDACAHGVINNKLVIAGGIGNQVWMYDPVTDKWSRSADSFRSFTSGVGFTIMDQIFYAIKDRDCHSMRALPLILGYQYLGEVKKGQTIFYKTYAADATVQLEGADLPQGASVAKTDGYLTSQFQSNSGVIRGWVK